MKLKNFKNCKPKTSYKWIIMIFSFGLLLAVGSLLADNNTNHFAQNKTQSENIEKTDNFSSLFNVQSDETGDTTKELFYKTMFAVVIIIGLGAVSLFVSKRLLPKITNSPDKEIHILETTHIGPRKSLHLLEVGNQRLLIGSTNDNITILAHLTDSWLEIPEQKVHENVGI